MIRSVFFSAVSCVLFWGFSGCMHGVVAEKQAGKDAPAIRSVCVKLTPKISQAKEAIPGVLEISCAELLKAPWSNVLDEKIGNQVRDTFSTSSVDMPTDLKVLWVDSSSGKTTRQQLTAIAGKLGVAAVVERHANAWRVFPMTKMLQRLTMEPLAGVDLGTSPGKAISAAVLAHLADGAFYRADFAGSCILAQSAMRTMKDRAPGCSFDAPLFYLAWKSARRDGCDEDDIFKRFKSSCLAAKQGSWPKSEKDFFSILTELESARSTAWTKENLPSSWNSEQGRRESLSKLRAVAKELSGPRAELINTLADELEAFTMAPSGPCDHETAERRKEKMAAAVKRLFMLGRADLSSYVPGLATSGGQVFDPDGIMLWQKMVQVPDMAWVRMEKMSTLLWKMYMDTAFWQQQLNTAGPCKTYVQEVHRRVEQDRWPEHSKRALDILTGASLAYAVCNDRGPVDREFQKILDDIQEKKDGKLQVLISVAWTLPQILANYLTGVGVNGSLAQLATVVQGRMKTLGDSPQDRALGSCLKTFLIIEPALKGDFYSAMEILEGVEKDLHALPYPPAADAPAILRIAPGYHVAVGYVLATAYGLMKKHTEFEQMLSRIEPRVNKSVSMLLHEAGADAHIPQATALMAVVDSVVGFVFSTDEQKTKSSLDKILSSVKAAWIPLEKKGDWWNISLSSADIILADTVALLWKDKLGRDMGTELMRWSTKRIGELVRSVMNWYSLQGPSYDLFLFVQPAHQGLVEYFSLGNVPDRTQKTLRRTWAGCVPVLHGLAPLRTRDKRMKNLLEGGSITDLFMEVLWNIEDVGFEKVMNNDKKAMASLLARAGELDKKLYSAGRRQLRFLLDVSMGVILKLTKRPAEAHSWLHRAAEKSTEEGLGDALAYLQSLDSHVWLDENKVSKARAVLRHAMEPAFQAKKCKSIHPTMALYLPLAYFSERDGAHELAMAQLDEYLRLVDSGFAGEGKIQCKYSFNSGNALVQMTLNVALSNVVQSSTTEQSWQVGLGAQSKSMEEEKLVCTDSPIGYLRYDRVVLVHGLQAFYSLLHADDVSADLYLRKLRQDLETINKGNSLTLNQFELGGLEFAKTNLYSPMLFWTGLLAQLRGHTIDGEALEAMAMRLTGSTEQEQMQDMGLSPGVLPSYLQGMADVARMQPFFARWFKVSGKSDSLDSETIRLLNGLHRALPHVVPRDAKDLLQAAKYTGEGEMEKARIHLRKLKASSSPSASKARLLDEALALMTTGKFGSVKKLVALTKKAVADGFFSDAMKTVSVLQDAVLKRDGKKAAVELVGALRPKVPDERSEFTLQLLLFSIYRASGDKIGQLQSLEQALAHCKGIISGEEYFTYQYYAVMLAVELGLFEKAHKRISAQIPIFRSIYGDNETVAGMVVMELALRVVLGEDWTRDELVALSSWFDSANLSSSKYAKFLLSAIEALDAKQELAALCKKFLRDEAASALGG